MFRSTLLALAVLGALTANGSARDAPKPSGNTGPRYQEYAKILVTQCDLNQDGVLDDEEIERLPEHYRTADADHDQKITVAELSAHLAGFTRRVAVVERAATGEKAGIVARPQNPTPRAPARRYTAWDHLPPGLPDWFLGGDADGDGQVSMAEFSTVWDDAKIAAFAQYDLNNDGVITARECLKALRGR